MTTAAVTPLIAISTITNVLSEYVFGMNHSLEILDELVAFCVTVEDVIVTELGVTQLGTILRSFPERNKQKLFKVRDLFLHCEFLTSQVSRNANYVCNT